MSDNLSMADTTHVALISAGTGEWNNWRGRNGNVTVDLSGADLSRRNLRGANLHGARLADAKLRGSDLGHADLTFAQLQRADLAGATLSYALLDSTTFDEADLSESRMSNIRVRPFKPAAQSTSFDRAKLRSAALTQSVFQGASFRSADLRGTDLKATFFQNVSFVSANLAGAHLGGGAFTGADFNEAVGLHLIVHDGPTQLDIDTIRRNRLPTKFLHGCGLSDVEIRMFDLYDTSLGAEEVTGLLYELMEARTFKPIQMHSVFISYSHADAPFVDKLGSYLDRAGIRFWRDRHDMVAGRMETQIDRAIRLNPLVIVVLSGSSVSSDWVEWEVSLARELEKQLGRDVLCPVALDHAWQNSRWSSSLQQQVRKYYVLDFGNWETDSSFAVEFERLKRGLGLNYTKSR
jgi:uncharacterized protein YjbI with pentapeptide repeats